MVNIPLFLRCRLLISLLLISERRKLPQLRKCSLKEGIISTCLDDTVQDLEIVHVGLQMDSIGIRTGGGIYNRNPIYKSSVATIDLESYLGRVQERYTENSYICAAKKSNALQSQPLHQREFGSNDSLIVTPNDCTTRICCNRKAPVKDQHLQ
jgi:hypothetical protein